MHVQTSTLFIILALLPLIICSPSSLRPEQRNYIPDSIAHAQSLGIDVLGPIPHDAVLQRDGSYVAEPDTRAWAWIRAQIDLPDTPGTHAAVVERQGYANIGIGFWAKDDCYGVARYADNVIYSANFYTGVNMYSVGIAYRGLRNDEQLDFSRFADGDSCGEYLYSAPQNQSKGCFNSQLVNCFRLWIP